MEKLYRVLKNIGNTYKTQLVKMTAFEKRIENSVCSPTVAAVVFYKYCRHISLETG